MTGKMILWCALLLALLVGGPARAEIAVEDSIEWLTAAADRVITGRITELDVADAGGPGGAKPAAQGKSRGLALFLVQATQTLKGSPQPALSCVGVRDVPAAELRRLAAEGTELIFFLDKTEQATSFRGHVCDQWPLRGGDIWPYMIPLDRPGKKMLSARSLQVLGGREAIVSACQKTLAQLPAATRNTAAAPGERRLLEVPPDSPVYRALYGGSACYLYVPRALFPAAKASFR